MDKYLGNILSSHICLEQTLALIKPDAVDKEQEIIDILLNSGFAIAHRRKVHLSPEQVSDFYKPHYGKMFFPALVAYISNAPIVALLLYKSDAISALLHLAGPTNPLQARETHPGCLRGLYGSDQIRNAVHASENVVIAEREIKFLFQNNIMEPIPSGIDAKDYLNSKVIPTLFKGLVLLSKTKPEDPATWLADWLISHNPNQPIMSFDVAAIT